MRFQVIRLRDDRPVTLLTYILDKSTEIAWRKRPAIVICPGGAFLYTSDREAEPVAQYSCPGDTMPLCSSTPPQAWG